METGPAPGPLIANAATAATDLAAVNNAFYEGLGDRWYEAYDDPVALLRAEGELKNPWVSERIRNALNGPGRILDIGCGAGFLANALAAQGHRVSGVDMSRGSLKVAASRAFPASVPAAYRIADAYRLPYRDAAFDVVTAMDFLEHVTAPERVIAEAARVLRPGGLFFFHTFNRNLLAWLIVIKGLEWFVRNTPERMHVLPLFIKPAELDGYCARSGMRTVEMTGMRPCLGRAFWRMLATRRVPRDFRFRFTPSLGISYVGYARKSA
ncbi:MAG TPA: bifunctional 2-polyprenyl-6-hydroxyphenol methylase/3-demethylubiquinol 3-O-methyltransferase UbiG [Fibrobacteria bacterium]|nr:bifunctional 2-polyprenyl-6-hydroxyphenol methylase/3-demethylubiquinol 3-O-methyltransferase UbiG [Fibrobacteria bacterium]